MQTPPICNYEGSDYQTSFWEQGGRQYEDAVAQYTEAVRLNPRDAITQNNLANALLKCGRLADALPGTRIGRLGDSGTDGSGAWPVDASTHRL